MYPIKQAKNSYMWWHLESHWRKEQDPGIRIRIKMLPVRIHNTGTVTARNCCSMWRIRNDFKRMKRTVYRYSFTLYDFKLNVYILWLHPGLFKDASFFYIEICTVCPERKSWSLSSKSFLTCRNNQHKFGSGPGSQKKCTVRIWPGQTVHDPDPQL